MEWPIKGKTRKKWYILLRWSGDPFIFTDQGKVTSVDRKEKRND